MVQNVTWVDDEATLATISSVYDECAYLLDPHSAIGVAAARSMNLPADVARITLATAHPAKFPAAVASAIPGVEPSLPAHLADLFEREERFSILDNDLAAVQQAMRGTLAG